jgi:hypothetical protein
MMCFIMTAVVHCAVFPFQNVLTNPSHFLYSQDINFIGLKHINKVT